MQCTNSTICDRESSTRIGLMFGSRITTLSGLPCHQMHRGECLPILQESASSIDAAFLAPPDLDTRRGMLIGSPQEGHLRGPARVRSASRDDVTKLKIAAE